MTALEIVRHYFDLSNKSDFEGIAKLFSEGTVYHSANTGEYTGVNDIIKMQKAFHGKFKQLHWNVNSVQAVEPDTILSDYDFTGTLPSGEIVQSTGLEYVTVHDGKIQKIVIQGK